MKAACNGTETGIVEYLLRAGADVNAKNNKGFTAVDIAIQNQHKELAELITNLARLELEDAIKEADTGYEFDI